MNMKSIVTARWESESEAVAIEIQRHVLDFANAGLVELTVTHVATDEREQGDASNE